MHKAIPVIIASLVMLFSLVFVNSSYASTVQTSCSLTGTGNNCGPYLDHSIPMSNGYNTYVSAQDVGANKGTTVNIASAPTPEHWKAVVNAVPYGYGGVQTWTAMQQLTNDWGNKGWNGNSDTPLASLSAFKVTYNENMGPVNKNTHTSAEFAADVWTDQYPSDVMFWVDTQGRCNPGAYGTIIGKAILDGQTWTVNRYGGKGAEIIFVLDRNPRVPDSCATRTHGTIDIGAGYHWLIANGYMKAATFPQFSVGWEITSASHETFTMNNLATIAIPKK